MIQALFDDVAFTILLTGVLTAASAALLGTFLVVRGQAMLSDAISHGVVFGVAVTFLLSGVAAGPLQLLGAGAAGLLTVLLTEWLAASGKVKRDAATGLVFPALFAAGILLLNLEVAGETVSGTWESSFTGAIINGAVSGLVDDLVVLQLTPAALPDCPYNVVATHERQSLSGTYSSACVLTGSGNFSLAKK